MTAAEFTAIQERIGATDDEIAAALEAQPYVVAQWKAGLFRISRATALCMRMLADMDPAKRGKYLPTKWST